MIGTYQHLFVDRFVRGGGFVTETCLFKTLNLLTINIFLNYNVQIVQQKWNPPPSLNNPRVKVLSAPWHCNRHYIYISLQKQLNQSRLAIGSHDRDSNNLMSLLLRSSQPSILTRLHLLPFILHSPSFITVLKYLSHLKNRSAQHMVIIIINNNNTIKFFR